MRSLRTLAPLAVAALALVPSCNALFPFNADQACETQVHAVCHFAYACCTATERGTFAAAFGADGFRNEGECVDELLRNGTAECGNSLAVQDAINENRFVYDGALAQQCLQPTIDAFNQCKTDVLFDANAANADAKCAGLGFGDGNFAFGKGKVKAGKPCFQAFECEDAGSLCDVVQDNDITDGNLTLTAVGVCKAPAKEGEDCSVDTGSNGLCEPGTFCNADNVCEKIVLKQDGQDCFQDQECDSNFCNDLNGIGGAVCAEKLNNGDECLDNNDCISNDCVDDGQGALTCQDPPKLIVNACNGIQADDTKF